MLQRANQHYLRTLLHHRGLAPWKRLLEQNHINKQVWSITAYTHTLSLTAYSNNTSPSPAQDTCSIIHPKNYSQLTHTVRKTSCYLVLNSWSGPQILMMCTVYCCLSTWPTTCCHNELTDSGILRFRREEWLRGNDGLGRRQWFKGTSYPKIKNLCWYLLWNTST